MDSTSTTDRRNANPTSIDCPAGTADDRLAVEAKVCPPRNPTSNLIEAAGASALTNLYGPITEEMAQIERMLQRELQSRYEALGEVLRHGTQLGGKRLRPAMLLLAGSASGLVHQEHVVLGTVVEMVHTATLVHDDVLDQADTRRHVATVNARWSEHTSILLGDYLFAQSFKLAATLSSTEACRWIGEAARKVCEGELRQVLQRDALDLSEEVYLEIIRGKTAELCEVACGLGAKCAGASNEATRAMQRYGSAVGIAFQIADDYLDLWGDESAIGKTLGTDIQQGKATLPIIRLLDTASDSEREETTEILTGPVEDRVSRILPCLARSDAQQYTRKIAEGYRRSAIKALDVLAESPAKQSLAAIANFAVDRRF